MGGAEEPAHLGGKGRPAPSLQPAALASANSKKLLLRLQPLGFFAWLINPTANTLVPPEMFTGAIYIDVILQKLPHHDRHVRRPFISSLFDRPGTGEPSSEKVSLVLPSLTLAGTGSHLVL